MERRARAEKRHLSETVPQRHLRVSKRAGICDGSPVHAVGP